ncbi:MULTISPECIES: acyl-CoA dehydrogenase family protein [Amycolatopsis]|uniref:Alkylation response protein AidB-like acyl-CoA dehydrogenase n=1 Tax=Amycolatopsis thermoflava TaxID=84480 RepID=A0A3N2H6F6_9PSEU|nr:acyl-CoA dehydrogenase family protein [Amycolatopsis thermoflava]ROS44467.1 alkylation response protein AidB-like acyl-CoA dehydrogenase [Amycolatopsis thermoflava]
MDFQDSERGAALRRELRDLVRSAMPREYLGAFTTDPRDLELAQNFCKLLADKGQLTPAWPVEYGGAASSPWEQAIMREEMWAHFEPRGAQYMGVNWVGPAIMRFGTEAQRAEHLERIARGQVIWCQGFSEPEAGSDLASLRTAAVADGDGWRVRGQKIWTSYATMADWCFLLARTSRGDKKHHGITVFLVPMDRPGIRVVPIKAMVGPHHLNEVYFDDVVVTREDVLGEVDQGWSIVREALAFERVGIARYARCDRLLNLAPVMLADRWDALPAELKQRWAKALVHTRQARLLAYRVIEKQETGTVDPADAAAYRIVATQVDQEVAEVLMDMIEERAVGAGDAARLFERAVDDHWRYAQAATVASGSIEVQRMLLSRTLLGAK